MHRAEVEDFIETMFFLVNRKLGLKTGDISPEESMDLDKVIDDLTIIINRYIKNNRSAK